MKETRVPLSEISTGLHHEWALLGEDITSSGRDKLLIRYTLNYLAIDRNNGGITQASFLILKRIYGKAF